MKQRQLGPSGLTVGEIGLGGMPLSVKKDRPSQEEAVKVLLQAADAGMTLWDTADAYCWNDTETGHNERIFADAFAQLPTDLKEKVIIATKGGHIRPNGEWRQDGRPEHLREAVDASLKSLRIEAIPLYQYHRVDPNVPIEDSLAALVEARDAGKIIHIGLSNVSAAQIDAALKVTPIVSVQNQYSFQVREPEDNGVLDKCSELGLAFLPWSPLGGIGNARTTGVSIAQTIADELGVSPQRVALAWHLSKYERLIPIPGVSRVESALDSAKGGEVELTQEQINQLDEESRTL